MARCIGPVRFALPAACGGAPDFRRSRCSCRPRRGSSSRVRLRVADSSSSADPGDVGRYHEFADAIVDGQLPVSRLLHGVPARRGADLPRAARRSSGRGRLQPRVQARRRALRARRPRGARRACSASCVRTAAANGRDARASSCVTPVALGAVVLNRYDLWPALLVVLALLALLAGAIGLGFGAARRRAASSRSTRRSLLPVAIIHVLRTRGRDALVRVVRRLRRRLDRPSPRRFALLAPGGVRYSVKTQLVRQLQLESLGCVARCSPRTGSAPTPPGSSPASPARSTSAARCRTRSACSRASLLLAALGLVVVALLARRSRATSCSCSGFAASVTAFVDLLEGDLAAVPRLARARSCRSSRDGCGRRGRAARSAVLVADAGRGGLRAPAPRGRVAGLGAARRATCSSWRSSRCWCRRCGAGRGRRSSRAAPDARPPPHRHLAARRRRPRDARARPRPLPRRARARRARADDGRRRAERAAVSRRDGLAQPAVPGPLRPARRQRREGRAQQPTSSTRPRPTPPPRPR